MANYSWGEERSKRKRCFPSRRASSADKARGVRRVPTSINYSLSQPHGFDSQIYTVRFALKLRRSLFVLFGIRLIDRNWKSGDKFLISETMRIYNFISFLMPTHSQKIWASRQSKFVHFSVDLRARRNGWWRFGEMCIMYSVYNVLRNVGPEFESHRQGPKYSSRNVQRTIPILFCLLVLKCRSGTVCRKSFFKLHFHFVCLNFDTRK